MNPTPRVKRLASPHDERRGFLKQAAADDYLSFVTRVRRAQHFRKYTLCGSRI